jgi:hypothetical protein
MPKETRSLSRSQRVVEFTNGTRVEAGPFAGTLTQWRPAAPGLRTARLAAERDVSPDFEAALAEVGIVEQETIDLDVEGGTAALRSMSRQAAAADRVVIRPAPPRRDAVQVIWYQDESGGVSWHFPDGFLERAKAGRSPESTQRSVLRAARGATFTIPTRTAGARRAFATGQPSTRLRGPIVKLGRKIFKVLMVPLSKVIARPLEKIVGRIERKKRQELIRRLTADDYRRLVTEPFSDWKSLDGKRSLLVVHGIFSSTHGMLSGFPPTAMERLIAGYGGRAIALDQITVSRSPEQNAADFLRAVKKARPNGRFEFDVLCHSRGGVVSRTLAERGRSLVPGHNCSFGRVYFVAAPNAGSPLADAGHAVDMIDVFTNLITNFPDGPVLYAIEIVLAIVKLIAYTAEARLPGIAAMGTEGYIPGVLNAAPAPDPAPRYAASCSDYEPGPGDNGFLNGRLADSVIDRVFGQAANDLVTPRDGVFAANGHPLFPIAGPVVYDASEHVWHSDFFRRRRTLEAIFDHFEVDLGGGFELSAAAGDEEEVVEADEPAAEEEEADLDEMVEELLGEDAGDEVPVTNGGRRGGTVAEPPRGLGFGGGGGFRSGGGPARRRAAAAGRGGRAPARRPGVRRSRRRATEAPQPAARRSRRAPEAAPERIERRPEIDFHEQVREGETNDLVVRLADVAAAGGGGGRIAIDFAAEEETVELTVRLHAPGFDVAPEPVASMTVHRVRRPESEEVRFALTARRPGEQPVRREVTAEFWLRNALIGAVTHYTFVVPRDHAGGPGDGSSRVEGFALPPVRRQDCDVIVMIEGRDQPGRPPFRVRLRSEIPGFEVASLDCGLLDLPGDDLGKYVRTALEKTIGLYPVRGELTEREFDAELAEWDRKFLTGLEDLGKKLWTFLPKGFRDEYFAYHRAGVSPRSILVHSDEMVFPWELVIPTDLDGTFEELPPLGVNHVLGRWLPALRMKPSPQRLRVDKFVVLNPTYPKPDDLPWTVAEVTALARLFPKVEQFRPSTAARFRSDLLKRGDVRLLHFSGHGTFDAANADLSEILLEDDGLDAMAIARTRLGAEGSPIVYLNACSVGSIGITVGRAGGFAAACLEGGFSGVIAPYWPINDKRAARFALSLYKKLLAGRAIGEAMQELRAERPDDPTARAFAYFGDPWARLDLEALVA